MRQQSLGQQVIDRQSASLIALAALATVARGMRVVARPSAAQPHRPRIMLCHASLGSATGVVVDEGSWDYCAELPSTPRRRG